MVAAEAEGLEACRYIHMVDGMIGYSLYILLAVGLTILLTAVFRSLRRDDKRVAPPEEDAAFDRRIAEIKADYGPGKGKPDGETGRPTDSE